jgi:hypothetical protein
MGGVLLDQASQWQDSGPLDAEHARRAVLGILGVGTAETDAAFARAADYPDWEDQLQYAAAESQPCEYLITRNVSDFPTAPVHAVTPSEFLALAL